MKRMRLWKLALASSTFACATLLSFGWTEQGGLSVSTESAQARIGRPLTPFSVAGVARRQYRRTGYGYGAAAVGAGLVGAAAVGTAAATGWGWNQPYYDGGYYRYSSYGDNYYGGGYANRSYVTGRPTLIPRYYGGGYAPAGYYGAYAADSYPTTYGAFAAPSPGYYGGVYANRSYITGRPTLIPRRYGW
jgi:hypothetical protein